MQNLSVAIITFNEEANIGACIESVKNIADEVVVIDCFSSDNTIELARSKGATVIQNKFEGHIQQKNFALTQCSNSHVLSIDADERIDELATQEILLQKQKDFPYDAYILKRLTFIGNKPIKYGSWYPDKKLRLVKKELANWEGINPHDTLVSKSANILTLKGNILHFSYKNTQELFEKTKKYSEISAHHLFSLGRKVSPFMGLTKAVFRVIKHYFIKSGILAGSYGWQIARQQYYEARWKYQLLNKLYQEKKSKKQGAKK